MTKSFISLFTLFALGISSCNSTSKTSIPLSNNLLLDDTYTIIWNGTSQAYKYDQGHWLRAESYDYQFDVIQKRYDKVWKSIKSMHRIHPDYDGKAGDRDQTLYFEVYYQKLQEQKVQSQIQSSLGKGTGSSDTEFRNATLIMYVENPSAFMPYNKFRIKQNYNYEEGTLTETVELLLEKDGKETPFMKNEEKAWIFLKGKLDKAPSVFKD